jgi:hypothetical protein
VSPGEKIAAVVRERRICKAGLLFEDEAEPEDKSLKLRPDATTIEQVERARAWIRRFVRRATLNRTITAEMLRIQAEGQTGGEISTGAFMVACVLEGVMIRRTVPTRRDAYTNLSPKLAPAS